ncbi:TPA: Rop family plasmid primer RNA-binding protein [Escherichia coli]|nr:Rop family plasmid primer RNA-binding protein [Escherichia coli]
MNKQQQTVLNMAGFIKSQSLRLLEKLDALDADEPRQPGGCKSWCGRI